MSLLQGSLEDSFGLGKQLGTEAGVYGMVSCLIYSKDKAVNLTLFLITLGKLLTLPKEKGRVTHCPTSLRWLCIVLQYCSLVILKR